MDIVIYYFLVLLIAFLWSFIGTISAWAWIVTFSWLTLLGIPPHIAIATDTFGSLGFRLGALYNYIKHKKIIWNLVFPLIILSSIGGFIGANILIQINEDFLSRFIGIILLILLPIQFLKKNFGVVQVTITKLRRRITHFIYFLIEIWSAFFPPGSGLFNIFVMTKGYGLTILQVKWTNRIPSLVNDITATIVFFMASLIDFYVGITLFIGSLIGSYVGSHIAIKKGDAWIKPMMVLVIIIVSIKMIFF